MTGRREPTLRNTMADIGFLLRENISIVILMFALVAAFLIAGAWTIGRYSGSPTEDAGEVVRFSNHDTRHGDGMVVVVRSAGGAEQGIRASAASLSGCRIGSRIHLVRRGAFVMVAPQGCAPSAG